MKRRDIAKFSALMLGAWMLFAPLIAGLFVNKRSGLMDGTPVGNGLISTTICMIAAALIGGITFVCMSANKSDARMEEMWRRYWPTWLLHLLQVLGTLWSCFLFSGWIAAIILGSVFLWTVGALPVSAWWVTTTERMPRIRRMSLAEHTAALEQEVLDIEAKEPWL